MAHLELKLEGPESNAQSVNLIEHVTGRDEAGWRTVSVPLSRFDEIDLTQLAIVGLWKPVDARGVYISGEVVMDDIRFE